MKSLGPFNTLRLRQNGCHFPDNIFKWIFVNENVCIAITISLMFVPRGPINNIPALVQIMAWCQPGDKLLSEPMMVNLMMHICVTQPLWVKNLTDQYIHTLYWYKHGTTLNDEKHNWILPMKLSRVVASKTNIGQCIVMFSVTPHVSSIRGDLKRHDALSNIWELQLALLCYNTSQHNKGIEKTLLLRTTDGKMNKTYPQFCCLWLHENRSGQCTLRYDTFSTWGQWTVTTLTFMHWCLEER